MTNPSELTLLVLRLAFLALLWGFVFSIVYALRADLFGSRVRRLEDQTGYAGAAAASASAARAASAPPAVQSLPTGAPRQVVGSGAPTEAMTAVGGATKLVIISGPKAGTEIALGSEPLTIGRSGDSGLQIRDDYTSTHHARLLLWNDRWVLQDLDSTNGTFIDGIRVSVPTEVPLDTPVKIGATSFELRR